MGCPCGHRLQEEANKHRAMAAAAAQDASAVKRARFQASIDAAQLARFQAALGDGLLFGIVGALLRVSSTPMVPSGSAPQETTPACP